MTISIAFDQLGADNWPAFIGDVVEERQRLGHPMKGLMLGLYLNLLGPMLGAAEWFGINHSRHWGKR